MLERLKRRLGLDNSEKDALLEDLLEGARGYVMAYTGRHWLPPPLEELLVELAAMRYNRLGMEGESAHSEGGVSVAVEDLPFHIAQVLARYRNARVGG